MFIKKSIIAVDDSGIVLKTLEIMLSADYDFHGFSKAARALSHIKLKPPALIILDIDMPEVNGYEMLEMIKENDKLKDIPVIFLTSNHDKDYVIKAAKYGADAYVVKPVEKDVLIGKIKALIL